MNFEMHLEDNLFSLHKDIAGDKYKHLPYEYFPVFDNKKRDIHKAHIRDRVVHQTLFDYLKSFFETVFIRDSYASRIDKGQYKAINTFRYFIKLASGKRGDCYVLKCDVKKYFDNIDHGILFDLTKEKVSCEKVLKIIGEVISSHHSAVPLPKGVPLGNITSQIFANIYLNKLDHYVKKDLGCRFYVRYNDDLVVVFNTKKEAERIREKIILFAKEKLSLNVPIQKTSIRKAKWGIDFLGFVILPEAVLLRDKTKNKIYQNINGTNANSYLSILDHCNSFNLKNKILAMEKTFKT